MAEAGFDSRKFIGMATNADFFRQQLPPVMKEVVATHPPPFLEGQARWATENMYKTVDRVWYKGSNRLLMWVYGEYARANDVLKEISPFPDSTMRVPKTLRELSDDERRGWETYLHTTQLPKRTAIEAVRMNLGDIFPDALPSIRYIEDPSTRYLHQRLERASYQFVHSVFPDLSDDEAKKLYGQLTTAEEVRRRALEEDNGELKNPYNTQALLRDVLTDQSR